MAEDIEYKVLEAGWSTLTDRFFPITALRNIASQYKQGLGEYVFPFERIDTQIQVHRASHSTIGLFLRNNDTELWARIRPLNTPRGTLLRDHLRTKNVAFVVNIIGVVNDCQEVKPRTVQYLHVSAHGSFKK